MIYFIGVEHEVQSISVGDEETADQTTFRHCLEHAIETYGPTTVAEEFSDDALKKCALLRCKDQEFFTRRIATAMDVKHLLCDPDLRTKYSTMRYQEKTGWQMQLSQLQLRISRSESELFAAALEVTKDFPPR